MTRAMALSSSAGTIQLGAASGIQLGLKSQGFGWPGIAPQYFEGATGRRWRGSRVVDRVLPLQVKVSGQDANAVRSRLSTLAQVIAPSAGLTRLTVTIDGVAWWVDMTVTGRPDWSYDGDTDGATVVQFPLRFETEQPFWTRLDQASAFFLPPDVDVGLLGEEGSMVGMTLSSVSSFGEVQLTNAGDAEAPMLVKVEAPFSAFAAISPDGEEVSWDIAVFDPEGPATKETGFILIDMGAGTAVDEEGANVYAGLNDVPRFWTLKPGTSTVTLSVDDAEEGTRVTVFYYPRKWVMF